MICRLFQLLKDRVRALAQGRDPRFPAAERAFILANPTCFLCHRPATTAHHAYPVHAYRELEMVERYWRAVDHDCHLTLCHNRNWRKWVRPHVLDKIARLYRGEPATHPAVALLLRHNTVGPARPVGEDPL